MPLSIPALRQEVFQEFNKILSYWINYSIDEEKGGFYGRINADSKPVPNEPKSIVINSRILWAFSTAYIHFRKQSYLAVATRAFNYIETHFVDKEKGGVYWSVNADGSTLERKKQMYGHAFAIYGLSEYYRATKQTKALDLAIELYKLIEKHSFDPLNGGYVEAFAPDWSQTNDYILSKGDHRKSMNTHLHLLEAYTNLYRAFPDIGLRQQLKKMLGTFTDHIIANNRMRLFFDEEWTVKSTEISYGHDIEASWLLWEAAEVLDDKPLLQKIKDISINMAKTAVEGLAVDGGLNYELNVATNHLNTNKDWWVQAEAMVGFYNAYQLTGKVNYLEKATNSWEFIKKYLIDKQQGEWFWGVKGNHSVYNSDKVNFWKCPYHNARACLEIWRRTEA